jgi:very-short-patch-repair endonuclease
MGSRTKESKPSTSGMNDFIHHMKDGSVQGVGFVHLRAFLDWLKTQKRVVIEMDGDIHVIRTL